MNLPALSAAIVHAIRNSMADSAVNQADMVQNMIAEATKQTSEQTATDKPYFISDEVKALWGKADEAIAKCVREHNLQIERLTEAQCVQAIIQAFQSGDFKRLVRVSDNAQQVVYLPFAECEALRESIRKHEAVFDEIHDALDNYWRAQPDTLSAVQAVVADANKFRIELSKARQALLECPWPEDVWTSTLEQTITELVKLIPDGDTRTAICGVLMRQGWRLAEKAVNERLES